MQLKIRFQKPRIWRQFEDVLKQQGISIDYKHKGQTDEVQGVSFKKGEYSFKGSDVDRKFSYAKLDTQLNANSHAQEQSKETTTTLSENIVSTAADIASSIGGLFDIQPSDYDPNEAEALRKKKKKKPQKRKGISR